MNKVLIKNMAGPLSKDIAYYHKQTVLHLTMVDFKRTNAFTDLFYNQNESNECLAYSIWLKKEEKDRDINSINNSLHHHIKLQGEG